jgi:hypothetical protein
VEHKESDAAITNDQQPKHRIKMPGFVEDQEIGLGDVIKRATEFMGVKACGDCEKRATALNQWLKFSGRRAE